MNQDGKKDWHPCGDVWVVTDLGWSPKARRIVNERRAAEMATVDPDLGPESEYRDVDRERLTLVRRFLAIAIEVEESHGNVQAADGLRRAYTIVKDDSSLDELLKAADDQVDLKTFFPKAEESATTVDLLHDAWTILGNVGSPHGGAGQVGWETQPEHWIRAAVRWRDAFFALMEHRQIPNSAVRRIPSITVEQLEDLRKTVTRMSAVPGVSTIMQAAAGIRATRGLLAAGPRTNDKESAVLRAVGYFDDILRSTGGRNALFDLALGAYDLTYVLTRDEDSDIKAPSPRTI
jgi:hypothetical protein